MSLYKKKNLMWSNLRRLLLPATLWTRGFTAAWLGALVTLLLFDLLWCIQTTFRGMSFPATYINALTLATLLSLPAILTRRRWVMCVVLLLADALLIANLMYCRTYFNSIPPASYLLAGHVMDFSESIFDSWNWTYLLLPLVALLTPLFMHGGRRRKQLSPSPGRYLGLLVFTSLLSAVSAFASGGLRSHVAHLKEECYYATTPAVIYTIPGTILAELATPAPELSPSSRRAVDSWLATHEDLLSKLHTPEIPDSLRRTNLVMVFCESLESWPVGATIEGKPITPVLNSLLSDSTLTTWYAPHVLSQVGNGRSIDGQLLMLTGLYPMRNYVYAMKFPSHTYPALPDAMRRSGATTYLLSGDKPSTWNQGLMARAFGIDHTEMADRWDNSERIGNPKRLSDRSLMAQTVAKMKQGTVWPEGERGYVQIVTYTGHNPFRIPAEHRTLHLTGSYPEKLADYATAVHYTDSSLGLLLTYLRSRSDWPQTMVAIVGDHEALGTWRNELRASAPGNSLVNPTGFVPLIVINSPIGGVHKEVMGQADVYPTLLSLLSLPYPWRGLGFPATAPEAPGFALDFQGNLSGTPSDSILPGMKAHVKAASEISNTLILHNMLRKPQ